jgi:hypothetical protein
LTAIAGTQAAARMKARTGTPTQYRHQQKQTLAKVVKPVTACREANYSRDSITIRDDSSSMDSISRNIVDVNRSRTARISRKFSNTREARNKWSRDASNIRDISRSRYSQA